MALTQELSFLFTIFFFFLLFLLKPISAVHSSNQTTNNATDFIRTSCNVTLYPDICYTTLSGYSNAVEQNPAQLARLAIRISLSKSRQMTSYISNIMNQTRLTKPNPKISAALKDCRSTFNDAVYQMKRSLEQMSNLEHDGGGGDSSSSSSFRFFMSNVQTWMSAALTNEETCTDGFEVVENCKLKSGVCNHALVVKKLTSNALALVNSFASNPNRGITTTTAAP